MRINVGLLVAVVVAFLGAGPALAAKVLTDDDLDQITAGGEPKVIMAEATGEKCTDSNVCEAVGEATATHIDEAVFTLHIPTDAQKGLRALTVANVVGEAQLLVNLNVLSAQKDVAGTDQRNFSVQSWGSTLPIPETVATVPGVTAAAAPCLNAGSCVTSGGDGGSADSNDAGNGGQGAPLVAIGNGSTSTSPGVIAEAKSASGDVIIKAKGEGKGVSIDKQEPIFTLAFDSLAQVDLAALFIANVVGRVQAAYNINIAAATLNLIPDPGTAFATPFENATGVIKQVNSGVQFRGTPIQATATIDITHTPN